MARSFSSKDAKGLIARMLDVLGKLEAADSLLEQYGEEIETSSQNLVDRETFIQLSNIPVEEINRGKNRFRLKALKDRGYTTMADLAGASVHDLASVKGIGEDSAYIIHETVLKLTEQVRQGIKIRLSTDNKNEDNTALVSALSRYRGIMPYTEVCHKLLSEHNQDIRDAAQALRPGTSGLRWVFTFGKRKQDAEAAYLFLNQLTSSDWMTRAREAAEGMDAVRRLADADAWDDFSAHPISFFNVLEEIVPGILGTDDAIYGLPEELAREIQDECIFTDGLSCELRKYQAWGVKYILHQKRVLLGDEMGLGKTIQAIAAMVSLRNSGASHFMVICPASVISNWCREISRHSDLNVTRIHGADRALALASWLESGGVAVTTYETTPYISFEEDFKYSLLVVDEAHYIKNASAKRSIHAKRVGEHAERMLFMTGTALENKVDEMISLISVLQPQVSSGVRGMEALSSAPVFREKVAPVYYRRKREDVLTELPELVESQEWCKLSGIEEEIYEDAVLEQHYADARRVSWNVDDLKDSSKYRRMLEIIEEAEEEGRKVLIFSFFLDTIRKIYERLGDRCLEPINGSVPPQRRQEIVDAFGQAPAGSVLLAQIQSGGTGLNI